MMLQASLGHDSNADSFPHASLGDDDSLLSNIWPGHSYWKPQSKAAFRIESEQSLSGLLLSFIADRICADAAFSHRRLQRMP